VQILLAVTALNHHIHQIAMKDVITQYVPTIPIVATIHGIGSVLIQPFMNVMHQEVIKNLKHHQVIQMQLIVVIAPILKIHQIVMKDVIQPFVHTILIVAIIHGIGYALILLFKNVMLLKRHHLMNHAVIVLNQRIHQIVTSNATIQYAHMIHTVAIIHGIGFVLILLFMNVMQLEVIKSLKHHQVIQTQ